MRQATNVSVNDPTTQPSNSSYNKHPLINIWASNLLPTTVH